MARFINNLLESKKIHVQTRKQIVIEELLKLMRDRAVFAHITGLARRLAEMVALQEKGLYEVGKLNKKKSQISYTTFLRKGSWYKHLLVSYMDGDQSLLEYVYENGSLNGFKRDKKGNDDFNSLIESNPALQALIAEKSLEIQELKMELNRIKKYVGNNSESDSKIAKKEDTGAELKLVKDDLDLIVTALVRLTQSIEYYKIDWDKEKIIDKSDFDKSVVNEKYLNPFFRNAKIQLKMIDREINE